MSARKVLVASLLLGLLSLAGTAAARNPKMSSKYEYTIGDDIAQRTAGILRLSASLEEAPLVYYDREKQNVVAEIVGSTDNVEGAKHDIEGLVDVIQSEVVAYARKRHHLELTDKDVTLIYYVDSDQGTPEELVRREEGQFVVPKDEDQEK
ncbi:MAG: hypothetical protein E6K76_01520 [Candidatus Eisenbacteria bacterium]|uniref:Uncharacterized protein n=1 Tax=Eiseniibacteriota bacterium TaxID=2212470 RepID=A0A538TAN2_UNCEI|nr:MAG: hypothetical protein E6K76_01520 [Candidatus Eisenbacteria bacterium]